MRQTSSPSPLLRPVLRYEVLVVSFDQSSTHSSAAKLVISNNSVKFNISLCCLSTIKIYQRVQIKHSTRAIMVDHFLLFSSLQKSLQQLLLITKDINGADYRCGLKERLQSEQQRNLFLHQLLNGVKKQSSFALGRKWPHSLTPVSYNNQKHSAAVSIICQVKTRSSSLACYSDVIPLVSEMLGVWGLKPNRNLFKENSSVCQTFFKSKKKKEENFPPTRHFGEKYIWKPRNVILTSWRLNFLS